MRGLGELAREYNVPAQSHLSENPGEIAWVAELCPGTKFYGESYSRYGLFGGGVPTVMAHCIYSPDDEAALMKQNRVMIAHCPTSNENVIAGIAPAAHYLRGGWRVGLAATWPAVRRWTCSRSWLPPCRSASCAGGISTRVRSR